LSFYTRFSYHHVNELFALLGELVKLELNQLLINMFYR
jgi:hypothetical protein